MVQVTPAEQEETQHDGRVDLRVGHVLVVDRDGDHRLQIELPIATDDGRPYFVMEYVDGLPITAQCVFSLGSVGKQFTAAAILLLGGIVFTAWLGFFSPLLEILWSLL